MFNRTYDNAACQAGSGTELAGITLGEVPDLAYLSYYSGGVRAITVGAAGIQEVGAFIDEGGNNFWGVEVFEQGGVEYAALSDRDFGLYIVKMSGQP